MKKLTDAQSKQIDLNQLRNRYLELNNGLAEIQLQLDRVNDTVRQVVLNITDAETTQKRLLGNLTAGMLLQALDGLIAYHNQNSDSVINEDSILSQVQETNQKISLIAQPNELQDTTPMQQQTPSAEDTTATEQQTPSAEDTTATEQQTPSAEDTTATEQQTPSAEDTTTAEPQSPTKRSEQTEKIVITPKRIVDRITPSTPILFKDLIRGYQLPENFELQTFLLENSNLERVILSSTNDLQEDTVLYLYPNFYNDVIAHKRKSTKINSTIQAILQTVIQGGAKPNDFSEYEHTISFQNLKTTLSKSKTFEELFEIETPWGKIVLTPTQKLQEMMTVEPEEDVDETPSTDQILQTQTPLTNISQQDREKLGF